MLSIGDVWVYLFVITLIKLLLLQGAHEHLLFVELFVVYFAGAHALAGSLGYKVALTLSIPG